MSALEQLRCCICMACTRAMSRVRQAGAPLDGGFAVARGLLLGGLLLFRCNLPPASAEHQELTPKSHVHMYSVNSTAADLRRHNNQTLQTGGHTLNVI